MELLKGPGLYIVTLTNAHPISVNAHDPRIADRTLKVTHVNCKFGKARVLASRRRNYEKTFGVENVSFHAIAAVADFAAAERAVLGRLGAHRMRGLSGWPTEWLENISPQEVHAIVVAALAELGVEHQLIPNAFSAPVGDAVEHDASPDVRVDAQTAPGTPRVFETFRAWVLGAALPLLAGSVDALRLDGRSSGGNREVYGRFRFADRVWRVHGDTHFEPVLTAFWAMQREQGDAALVVRATRGGECLELRHDLALGGAPKRFYVYAE